MSIITLCAALIAAGYGLFTAFRPKTPLFYQIVVYGFCCYLLCSVYSLLLQLLYGGSVAFHAGYLGYAGTFFFLFSSYFGALDRLADGQERCYRSYRSGAFLAPAAILILGLLVVRPLPQVLTLLPASATAYYACKHLILPDVDMGIIRVMRPYNAIILLICLLQPFSMGSLLQTTQANPVAVVFNALLMVAAVPAARMGVRKWFT